MILLTSLGTIFQKIIFTEVFSKLICKLEKKTTNIRCVTRIMESMPTEMEKNKFDILNQIYCFISTALQS